MEGREKEAKRERSTKEGEITEKRERERERERERRASKGREHKGAKPMHMYDLADTVGETTAG